MARTAGTTKKEVDDRIQRTYQLCMAGTPTQEVAQILGCHPTTVRIYIRKLRKRIDEHYKRSYAAIGRWASVRRNREVDALYERMNQRRRNMV
jgi:hypothetical protein